MVKSCSFTGHRPSKLSFGYDEENIKCLNLKKTLRENIVSLILDDFKVFYTGMALGADIWCADIVLELKKIYSDIKLICVIPCESQADRWSPYHRDKYFSIIQKSDEVVYISKKYTKGCMAKRNIYLVDMAMTILGVYNGHKGGTKFTLDYASKKQKEIILISEL